MALYLLPSHQVNNRYKARSAGMGAVIGEVFKHVDLNGKRFSNMPRATYGYQYWPESICCVLSNGNRYNVTPHKFANGVDSGGFK